ncbi:hypothetical protein JTB14_033621 [Gonioctena quinquepunctata]|nr:hypothetical protein JTB14_033621 [Gonioctena quinquepunctata]
MRWQYLRWLVVSVAVFVLQGHGAAAAPNPSNEDMMRELMKLDQMYSSIARPRYGKRASESNSNLAPFDYDSLYQSDQDVGEWLAVRR